MASKYRNVKTLVGHRWFHSKGEAFRYMDLLMLERAKEIKDLKLQVKFPLHAGDNVFIGHYIADFTYVDSRTGERVVEDFKGKETHLFKWKCKHLEAEYNIKLLITKSRGKR